MDLGSKKRLVALLVAAAGACLVSTGAGAAGSSLGRHRRQPERQRPGLRKGKRRALHAWPREQRADANWHGRGREPRGAKRGQVRPWLERGQGRYARRRERHLRECRRSRVVRSPRRQSRRPSRPRRNPARSPARGNGEVPRSQPRRVAQPRRAVALSRREPIDPNRRSKAARPSAVAGSSACSDVLRSFDGENGQRLSSRATVGLGHHPDLRLPGRRHQRPDGRARPRRASASASSRRATRR